MRKPIPIDAVGTPTRLGGCRAEVRAVTVSVSRNTDSIAQVRGCAALMASSQHSSARSRMRSNVL